MVEEPVVEEPVVEEPVVGEPHPWPYNGELRRTNTALMVIDMQTDFCGRGGYIELLRYDISITRACVEPISRVIECFRSKGYAVIHTHEGHRPDLSDLPENRQSRSRRVQGGARPQVGIGDAGSCGRVLVRGDAGNDAAALKMTTMQEGVFGAVSNSTALITTLSGSTSS